MPNPLHPTEHALIERLCRLMPRSVEQLNRPFESDAEILRWGHENLLFSTDEFSAEDALLTEDAFALGHNIACAALSDILATGGRPLFYAHSLTIDARFTESYLERFYQGIAQALDVAGAYFIGGDFGRVLPTSGASWRCVASVIGKATRPVRRSGAREHDHIYITGPLGAGNVQAVLANGMLDIKDMPDAKLLADATAFTLRMAALPDIERYATSCVDTSDGLMSAMNAIARQSACGFQLFDLPYLPLGEKLARQLGLPVEMLAFCEGGEYELLLTSPAELPYPRIGRVTAQGRTLEGRDVSHIDLSARAYPDLRTYLAEVKRLCAALS
ncbi:MAG: thiamine-phosphate kinase [Zoogloeaceae bacterium]|jgi:thiamine-monophosphate kinase|nr:thiamine-phosphate kinase [Zoogloeaceae bacterium]